MAFDSFSAFIAMGGYAQYVWASFVLSFVVLLALLLEAIWKRRRLFKQLQQQQARQKRMQAAQHLKNRL